MIHDEDGAIRKEAASTTLNFSTRSLPLITDLEWLIKKYPDSDGAWAAVYAIGGLGPKGITALPTLIWAIQYNVPNTENPFRYELRSRTAEAISKMGKNANSTLPELIKYKNTGDASCNAKVSEAILYIKNAR